MADLSKALTLRLEPDLHAALLERAAAEDRSIAAQIRVACRAYLAVVDKYPWREVGGRRG